jgi:LPS-assembly protein
MRHWQLTKVTLLGIAISLLPLTSYALLISSNTCNTDNILDQPTALTRSAIAQTLGWVESDINRCGGYYLESALIYPKDLLNTNRLFITSDQGLFSFHGTSTSQGKVTITRDGQQITANQAYLYRDPATGKLSVIDLFGNVRLHEPNQLIIGKSAHYNLKSGSKSLNNILYRATIYGDLNPIPRRVSYQEQQQERKVTQMSAWGQASSFSQVEPKVYEFNDASYSTCPPTTNSWKLKAKKIELNKITGKGYGTHARLYFKGVPVFYAPYFSFPIDTRRKSGFLFPRPGVSDSFGAYLLTPFYWNQAPNYDSTITPGVLAKRGLQVSDVSRYLTPNRSGQFNVSILPNDRKFTNFKASAQSEYQNTTNSAQQSDLRTLNNASTTRKAFSWVDKAIYNDKWSSNVNYNYVSDDYYLRDFVTNINEVTENQLLQQAEIDYTGPRWTFLTRLQGYQTLNQIDQNPVPTSYSRFPQFVLGGNYPDERHGLQYFVNNDVTRFDIRNSPGDNTKLPIGTRINIQPGISRPVNYPYFYLTPRLQFAFTQYEIGDITNTSKSPSRSLPILDLNSGLYFDRPIGWLGHNFKQTLEPQIYYTYIPYKNQFALPLFDTTLNTLTYDQLFTYNRFSGLDRIGDANQISLGVTTRLIEDASGYDRASAGIGQIYYFKKRAVTLCTALNNCSDLPNDPNNPNNPSNTYNRSPLSGVLKYNINPNWNVTANTIWNVKTSKIDNQSFALQYKPQDRQIINLGYNFARNGDIILPWVPVGSPTSNLSQTDLSFSWPVTRDWSALGRWTEDWNQKRLQNLLYGLQYDNCCWAVRAVGGRTFVAVNSNNTLQYNNRYYLEFSLKGLGNYGYGQGGDSGSSMLANNITGYQSNFGRDY